MELRHLQAFVAVAEELHFGRAAARLQLSSSPVSRTVAELERELHVGLFVRGHHHVALTDAGSALLAEARELLNRWSAFTAHGRSLADDGGGRRLRIGSPSLAPSDVVDRLVTLLQDADPDALVEVEFAASSELLQALRREDLQLTLALLPLTSEGLHVVPVAHFETAVVVSAEDELAGRESVKGEDLRGRRVLMISSSVQPQAIEQSKSWLRDHGAIVEQLPATDMLQLAHLVRHGRGITLTGTSGAVASVFAQPGLRTVPLADPERLFELGLVWKQDGPYSRLGSELADRLVKSPEAHKAEA